MATYREIKGLRVPYLSSDLPSASASTQEAQAVVKGVIDDAKDAWDADNVDGETSAEKITRIGAKPTEPTLP